MNKFDYKTKAFESRFVDHIAMVHLLPQAMDIVTKLGTAAEFYDLLDSINDSNEVQGYVQINGDEWDSHSDVDELAQFISQDAELFVQGGTYYGYQHDVIAARLRNTLGRILLAYVELKKTAVAGVQGQISGEYLGLTLAFDSRVATADTTISFDNVRTGLPASPGLTHLLPRYIGVGRAMSLIRSGATIDAREALSLGLLTDIVDDREELVGRCLEDTKVGGGQHRHLFDFHRRQILPSSAEVEVALKNYYEAMITSVVKLRTEC